MISVTDIEAQLSLIFVVIFVLIPVVAIAMFGKVVEETSEDFDLNKEEELTAFSEPEKHTENCKNCGGPNVDRVTCEWCGNVLESE